MSSYGFLYERPKRHRANMKGKLAKLANRLKAKKAKQARRVSL